MTNNTYSTFIPKISSKQIPFSSSSLSLSSLPQSPGIYIFQDEAQNPLYIGKSINIRSRIKQHLEQGKLTHSKQATFFTKTYSLKYIKTASDIQAVILEAQLIKTLTPAYNSISKDDKSALFITFSNPPSKITLVRGTDLATKDYNNPKTQIYGPYQNKFAAETVLKQARKIFGFCSNPFNSAHRACFYYHLGLCPGACKHLITPKRYQDHLTRIKKFFSGKFVGLSSELTAKIKKSAKLERFEQAQEYKKQLQSLQNTLTSSTNHHFLSLPAASQYALGELVAAIDHPKLTSPPARIECYDIANLGPTHQVGSMTVLIQGVPSPSLYRHFIIRPRQDGDPAAMRQMLTRRFAHPEWDFPNLVVLDGGVGQLNIVSPAIPKDIAVIALSKKKETIHFYKAGKIQNINIPLHRASVKLLQTVRDEAHRFATTFHKQRRDRQMLY